MKEAYYALISVAILSYGAFLFLYVSVLMGSIICFIATATFFVRSRQPVTVEDAPLTSAEAGLYAALARENTNSYESAHREAEGNQTRDPPRPAR